MNVGFRTPQAPMNNKAMLATPTLQSPQQSGRLQHVSYQCPGLHGKGSVQDIAEAPLSAFIKPNAPALVIPLFQRRYCWTERIISRWWSDVYLGVEAAQTRDLTEYNSIQNRKGFCGRHRVGKAVFKNLPDGRVCVIDGQQRVTTALLLIAALRDVALSKGRRDIVEQCDGALFRDTTTWAEWRAEAERQEWKYFDDTTTLRFSTLVPSIADRASFFELLVVGAVMGARLSSRTRESLQFKAYDYFREQIDRLADSSVDCLDGLRNKALDGISFMRINIMNDINYGQVFLWLQEKTLFSAAAVLHNPTPGEKFTAGDLARNLLLSRYMNESFEEQERLLRTLWLEPIEYKCTNSQQLRDMLERFLQSKEPLGENGSFEKTLAKLENSGISLFRPNKDMKVYGRFVTYFERLIEEVEDIDSIIRTIVTDLSHTIDAFHNS